MGLRSSIFINDNLCAYYIKLWAKYKKLWDNKFIHRFWVSYGLIKIKVSESSQIIGHKCIQIQESKIHLLFSSIAIFCFIILFLSKKIQNLTCLYRSIFLLTILYSSLAVQVKKYVWAVILKPIQILRKKIFFWICHWNFNSITALVYVKMSLSKTYITAHKMDIICLLKTYLDSSVQPVNENLEILG